ncbi:hypothetical protein CY34DRAFT_803065 [Suillus luteus UH-Slu-Lm8-n1]|uniref:Uncharacterized protein n=1 Tax=Suillus luteus UH-Slu-Lm8-n1 TaxID=930992 RepID=A0A0D0BLB3_9AGAM|nr:hypothetical protein CY34DRAFT_803065 [Suillus luteus UH-Slu-Lm8-n1]
MKCADSDLGTAVLTGRPRSKLARLCLKVHHDHDSYLLSKLQITRPCSVEPVFDRQAVTYKYMLRGPLYIGEPTPTGTRSRTVANHRPNRSLVGDVSAQIDLLFLF